MCNFKEFNDLVPSLKKSEMRSFFDISINTQDLENLLTINHFNSLYYFIYLDTRFHTRRT